MLPVLRSQGFEPETPQATMYVWVPLPEGVPSAAFQRRALEDAGVVTLPGSAFGAGGEGFFRIALTVGAMRLVEAARSEEHTSELQSRLHLVCRLLLEKKKSQPACPAWSPASPSPSPTAAIVPASAPTAAPRATPHSSNRAATAAAINPPTTSIPTST